MSPKIPDLHEYRHRQPLDRAHVVVIAETLSDDQVNYDEQVNFQAASAECRVPVTGQGKVTTVDPDLTFFVDKQNYQRITVLNSSLQLLHRLTYISPITVLLEKGHIVVGLQFIKHGSDVIPVTAHATGVRGSYRITHAGQGLHQEDLGEVNAEDLPALLSATLTLWCRNFAKALQQ